MLRTSPTPPSVITIIVIAGPRPRLPRAPGGVPIYTCVKGFMSEVSHAPYGRLSNIDKGIMLFMGEAARCSLVSNILRITPNRFRAALERGLVVSDVLGTGGLGSLLSVGCLELRRSPGLRCSWPQKRGHCAARSPPTHPQSERVSGHESLKALSFFWKRGNALLLSHRRPTPQG